MEKYIFVYIETQFFNNKINSFNVSKNAYTTKDDCKNACIEKMKNIANELKKQSICVKIDEEKLFLSFNRYDYTDLYSYDIKCLTLK